MASIAVLLFALVSPAPVGAQEDDTVPTTTIPEGGIIPRPNSGVEPQDPGDRGGSLQTFVFVVILVGVGVIGALVVRESRSRRSERGW